MNNHTRFFHQVSTDLGQFGLVASETELTHLFFDGETPRFDTTEQATPLLRQAAAELQQYLSGKRQQFTVPLDPAGTEFFRRAWQALIAIPYGETRSYAEQAQRIGAPDAVRAVGAANGRNPLPIVLPCHRVIGADGGLTGFGGGLPVKAALLRLEGALAPTEVAPRTGDLFG